MLCQRFNKLLIERLETVSLEALEVEVEADAGVEEVDSFQGGPSLQLA